MANGTYAPMPVFYGWDLNGDPVAGGLLFTYLSGTSTPATTWSNIGMTSANTNPVVLDASGRATVVLLPGISYKFVLAPAGDTTPPTSPIWSRDLMAAIPPPGSATENDTTGTAGEAISINDPVYLSDGSGGLTAGRWYRTDADQTYSSVNAGEVGIAVAAISSGASGTIRMSGRITGLSGLTIGALQYLSATAGDLTETAPTNARLIAQADSTTSAIVGPWVGTMAATATIPGVLTAGAQEIGGAKSFMDPILFAPGTVATAIATVGGVISTNITPVGNVGAGTDDLMSYTVLANTLSANGKALRVTAWGDFGANANVKSVIFNLGSDALIIRNAAAENGTLWRVEVVLVRITSASEHVRANFESVNAVLGASSDGYTRDLTVNNTLKFTAIGTADNDIRQLGMIVEVVG